MADGTFLSPLMIQYLTGLGSDLSAYGANTNAGLQPTGINKVTNENTKAQGFMKLLKQALGPDSSSVKIDGKGIGITAPNDSSLFKQIVGEELPVSELAQSAPTQESVAAPAASAPASAPAASPQAQIKMPNPFTLSPTDLNVAGTDLAGLSPENILAIVGAKQAQDQLKMQSYRDIVDSIYKGQAMQIGATKETREAEAAPVDIKYKKALMAKAEQDTENDKPIYKTDQGLMLNAKDYLAYQRLIKEDQTPSMKNYDFAKKNGFTGTFMQFQDAATTTHKKDYDEAVKGGYKGSFQTWMEAMAKAGAINLGDLMNKESALSKLQGEKYFGNPDWTKDLQGHVGSKDIQNRIGDVQIPDLGPSATKEQKQKAYRDASAKERAKVTIEFIEGKIAAGGGKVVANPTMAADGKTITWKVQWPSGNTTEVTQAVR